ncbi:hypothetical protein Y032_0217g2391 [Ancylostoma ceylanicum]|uniref:DH domain-containing protein n=2 Tax=Ancylostoma ceylanicum TaxID=53326 RepID=A0A016SJZ4_9BILA|nr:hypothetical protein Y032_0217g2391 [Ancylostoma ceylanicum]
MNPSPDQNIPSWRFPRELSRTGHHGANCAHHQDPVAALPKLALVVKVKSDEMLTFSLQRYHAVDIEGPAYMVAHFPDCGDTSEKIPVEPGLKLYQVFEEPLRARGLNVNDVEIFIERSSSAIPENADVRFLAGRNVIVRGRPGMRVGRHTRATLSMDEAAASERPSRKMSADAVSRKSSFAHSRVMQKARQDHRMHSSDDADVRGSDGSLKDSIMDEPSCSLTVDDGGTRRARSVTSSRISLFFAKEKEMLNKLNEMKERTEPISSIIPDIESHWTEIVADRGSLTRRHIDQQEAIWEIVTTEYRYIQVLKNMHDLSCYFIELQKIGYFKDISVARVFLNYSELFTVNVIFWRRAIQPLLECSRQTRKPFDPVILLNGFEDISEWSKCYIPFNLGHDDSHTYVQKKQKDNEMFREFVQWAESQESMRRQKLCDTLTSPMQRLTRYSLLLKAVLSNSTDDRERLIIQTMIDRTDAATQQLNFELNNNDLRLQMAEIMKSIDGYDAVDSEEFEKLFPNRRTTLDLMAPMPLLPGPPQFRRVIHRGNLKVRESRQGPKVEMHCLLFTDMLLLCKTSNKRTDRGLRVARAPIHIAHMIYHPFNDASGFFIICMNEFDAPSSIYLMHTTDEKETRRWLEMINITSNEFKRLQGRHSDYENSLYDLRKGPPWHQGPQHGLPSAVIHRKSSSMDSQVVAAHAHMNHMHRTATVSSTEQLDRNPDRNDSPSRLPPIHKLSVASYPLCSSKSSVDLHLTLGAETSSERPVLTRSRSNSSEPELDGKSSRSPSPRRKETMRRVAQEVQDVFQQPGRAKSEISTEIEELNDTATVIEEELVQPHGRRFEKRYHTADGIDVLKPKGTVLQGGILKRFSWNVSSAVGASSRKISARLGEHSRRHSQASTAASSESFGSSTSGISSSSSHAENECMKAHISTIAVNDEDAATTATLNICLDAPEELSNGASTPSVPQPLQLTPPLPNMPPPPAEHGQKHEDLLRFIMENHLETSDV